MMAILNLSYRAVENPAGGSPLIRKDVEEAQEQVPKEKKVMKCKECGLGIRGKNHKKGDHHKKRTRKEDDMKPPFGYQYQEYEGKRKEDK